MSHNVSAVSLSEDQLEQLRSTITETDNARNHSIQSETISLKTEWQTQLSQFAELLDQPPTQSNDVRNKLDQQKTLSNQFKSMCNTISLRLTQHQSNILQTLQIQSTLVHDKIDQIDAFILQQNTNLDAPEPGEKSKEENDNIAQTDSSENAEPIANHPRTMMDNSEDLASFKAVAQIPGPWRKGQVDGLEYGDSMNRNMDISTVRPHNTECEENEDPNPFEKTSHNATSFRAFPINTNGDTSHHHSLGQRPQRKRKWETFNIDPTIDVDGMVESQSDMNWLEKEPVEKHREIMLELARRYPSIHSGSFHKVFECTFKRRDDGTFRNRLKIFFSYFSDYFRLYIDPQKPLRFNAVSKIYNGPSMKQKHRGVMGVLAQRHESFSLSSFRKVFRKQFNRDIAETYGGIMEGLIRIFPECFTMENGMVVSKMYILKNLVPTMSSALRNVKYMAQRPVVEQEQKCQMQSWQQYEMQQYGTRDGCIQIT